MSRRTVADTRPGWRQAQAEPVTAVASRDVVSVAPDDTVFTALERLLAEEVEHLPVLEGGRLAGICTRTDVLRARRRQFEMERRQPGWRPPGRPGLPAEGS